MQKRCYPCNNVNICLAQNNPGEKERNNNFGRDREDDNGHQPDDCKHQYYTDVKHRVLAIDGAPSIQFISTSSQVLSQHMPRNIG